MPVSLVQRRLYSDLAHKYSKTLKLPQTEFPKRSNYESTINDLVPRSSQVLYKLQLAKSPIKDDVFILHDGPPYANGDLHMGHALNKILKDFINRFNLMIGKQVYYKPGWDCHGLPIELKALETINKKMKKDVSMILSVGEIREMARNHATKTVETQLESFKQFAILADFQDSYKTMNHQFEINQLRIFQTMLSKNLITRQKKPVFWGCETHTALAEGELEYNDKHKSTAAYLSFPLVQLTNELSQLLQQNSIESASVLIWTSTPWTIASNRAIAINEDFSYTVIKSSAQSLIVAKDLASQLVQVNPEFTLTGLEIPGNILKNSRYVNPISNESHTIIHGDHVTDNAGTGLVHTAPGHGNEDYFACLKNGIDIYSPVDNFGKYTKDVPHGFESLIGKRVLGEGGKIILKLLEDAEMVFNIDQNYIHSYPYDWRSKKPIIIRATPQWFANVRKIKEAASSSLDDVKFTPEKGKNRLLSFIKNRNEWCISRQRSWGVPIPALYSKHDENIVLMDQESVSHIITKIDELGTDAWFEEEANVERWLPESHRGQGPNFYKGKDTMDVWFDSGSSWNEIETFIKNNALNRDYLADVYLEGSDQHRGWFQSSLLTKIATDDSTNVKAPYKNIITHGFTLDEKGQKMSKSIGNTISPDSVIQGKNGLPALGVDGLRLWAAQADYTSDMAIGPKILKHVGDSLKKIRITFSFLLGSLTDMKPEDAVKYEDLRPIDKYALSKLATLNEEILQQYKDFNYNRVIQSLNYHLNADLSATYFDIIKDRLYTDKEDGLSRRAAQTVLLQIHQTYLSILSPILPILTQEVWDYTLPWLKSNQPSPFLKGWSESSSHHKNSELEADFGLIWAIKDEVKMLAEQGRKNDKTIRNSLETDVYININQKGSHLDKVVHEHAQYLADYLLVSHVHVNKPVPDTLTYNYTNEIMIEGNSVNVSVVPSDESKCPRCWKYTSTSVEDLCKRCDDVLN